MTGKTVLTKQRAIIEGENNAKPVYFVSLVATDVHGKPEEETKGKRIFDLLTEVEMREQNVTFLAVQDLLEFHADISGPPLWLIVMRRYGSGFTVYDLVEEFITQNGDISLFIDECPFLPQQVGDGELIFKAIFLG